MSMKFNGTELSDVYFNGTQLDKVYFNGILVFEKTKGYKRRIVPEDNLRGKTLYYKWDSGLLERAMSDWSETFIYENTMVVLDGTNNDASDYNNVFITDLVTEYEGYDFESATYEVYNCLSKEFILKGGNETSSGAIETTIQLASSQIPDDQDYIVTSVNHELDGGGGELDREWYTDNPTYRCIYIEDPYIKPLEPGDVLTRGTKMYFTIPDSALKELYAYSSIDLQATVQNDAGGQQSLFYWGGSGSIEGVHMYIDHDDIIPIYTFNNYSFGSSGTLRENCSYVEIQASWTKDDQWTVLEDDFANAGFTYNGETVYWAYVDTRTLVSTESKDYGYKRRIMVGDNLKNQIIYFDFPDNYYEQCVNYANKGITSLNSAYIYEYSDDETVWALEFDNDFNNDDPNDAWMDVFLNYYNDETNEQPVIYSYWTDGGLQKNISSITINGDKCLGNVYQIEEDDPSYKHTFIKMPNIRPLQVGDFINGRTQFYGVFPDSYSSNDEYGSICELDGGDENGYFDVWGVAGESSGKIAITMVNWGGSIPVYQQGSTYDYDEDINTSAWIAKDLDPQWFGEVTKIDNTLAAYTYVLVDETTLGQQFLRIPQINDYITQNTDFYYRYASEDIENTIQLIEQGQYTNKILLTLSNGYTLGEYYNASTSMLTVEWRKSNGTTVQKILDQNIAYAVPGLKKCEGIGVNLSDAFVRQVHNQEYLRKHVWLDSRTTSDNSHGGGSN